MKRKLCLEIGSKLLEIYRNFPMCEKGNPVILSSFGVNLGTPKDFYGSTLRKWWIDQPLRLTYGAQVRELVYY